MEGTPDRNERENGRKRRKEKIGNFRFLLFREKLTALSQKRCRITAIGRKGEDVEATQGVSHAHYAREVFLKIKTFHMFPEAFDRKRTGKRQNETWFFFLS